MLRIVLNIPHSSADCPAKYEDPAKLLNDIATWTDFYTDELFGSYEDYLPIRKVIYGKSRFYCDCERLGSAITGNTLLIDCHSFPSELAPDIDICIGYNEGEANAPSEKILKMTEQFFKTRGYNVARNKPYSNSITPLAAVRYHSMMIEVNKGLYLNADGSKRRGFGILQGQINDFYRFLLNNYRKTEKSLSKRPSYDNYIIKNRCLIPVIRERMSQKYGKSFCDEWAEELLRACLEYEFYEVRKGRWYQLAMWQTMHNFTKKYMPSDLFFETRDSLLADVFEQIEAAGIQSTYKDECRQYYIWYKNKWGL